MVDAKLEQHVEYPVGHALVGVEEGGAAEQHGRTHVAGAPEASFFDSQIGLRSIPKWRLN
jgi:hypothetical protein